MTKKQKHNLLLWGGLAAGAGLLYWWYSSQQTTTASTNTPASTETDTSTTQSSIQTTIPVTAQTPTNTDPTQPGAMVFQIGYVMADNQAGPYNLQFYLNITNNTSVAQTLQEITGQVYFSGIAAPYAGSNQPAPYTGLLGTVEDNTTVTIPAGESVGKLYVVTVPKTAAANFYLAQVMYINADPNTPRTIPFKFIGNAIVSNDNIPLNIFLNI